MSIADRNIPDTDLSTLLVQDLNSTKSIDSALEV